MGRIVVWNWVESYGPHSKLPRIGCRLGKMSTVLPVTTDDEGKAIPVPAETPGAAG